MAKVALMFVFLIVLVVSIGMAIGADAPAEGASGWSALADKVGSVFGSDDEDDTASPSPAAAVGQIRQAAGPALASMRGSAQAFASEASQAMDNAKEETVGWGDWFKHKLG